VNLDLVRTLVKEGRTLEAIRAYREATGADLDDALKVVDGLQNTMEADDAAMPQADRSADGGDGDEMVALEGPDVTALLQAGRKLDAIRLYRAQTGASLKDATDMIKELERKLDIADQSELEHGQDVETLLRAGRKIDAIRVYRQQHDVSLKAANDAVNALEKALGLRP
jgi:ribosomal protein L7/L12